MKILFDVNVPKGLRRHLEHHHVRTSQEQGWGAARNGELLSAAEAAGFDLMVTADKNLFYQQNLQDRKIAIIVLPSNDWSKLQLIARRIVTKIDEATAGSFHALISPPNS